LTLKEKSLSSPTKALDAFFHQKMTLLNFSQLTYCTLQRWPKVLACQN